VFLILVARAPATVWDVNRSPGGVIRNLAKKKSFVNHYSFHVMDPDWGHLTIKMSGHPPFAAQVILNGHEYVAACDERMVENRRFGWERVSARSPEYGEGLFGRLPRCLSS
jgi:hypothetical protein